MVAVVVVAVDEAEGEDMVIDDDPVVVEDLLFYCGLSPLYKTCTSHAPDKQGVQGLNCVDTHVSWREYLEHCEEEWKWGHVVDIVARTSIV